MVGRDHEESASRGRAASSRRPRSGPRRPDPSWVRRAAGPRGRDDRARPQPSAASRRRTFGRARSATSAIATRSSASCTRSWAMPSRSAIGSRFSRAVSSSYRWVRWVSSSERRRIRSAILGEVEPEHRALRRSAIRRGHDPSRVLFAGAVGSTQDHGLAPLDRGSTRTTPAPRRTVSLTPRRSTAASFRPMVAREGAHRVPFVTGARGRRGGGVRSSRVPNAQHRRPNARARLRLPGGAA